MEGRRAQIRLSARQVATNVSYTGGFVGMLASLVLYHSLPVYYLQSCQDLQLVYFLVVLTKQLVVVVLLLEISGALRHSTLFPARFPLKISNWLLANQNRGSRCIISPNFISVEHRLRKPLHNYSKFHLS